MPVAAILPGWLGDLVMAAPSITHLSRACVARGEELDLYAIAPLAPLAEALFASRAVIPYRKKRGFGRLLPGSTIAGGMKRGNTDIAVLLPNSFSSAYAAWRGGARRRIGTAMHGRSLLLTDRVDPLREGEHQADAYARVVAAAMTERVVLSEDDFTLSIPSGLQSAALDQLRSAGLSAGEQFVVLAPGAAYGDSKQWGAPSFAKVARALGQTGAASVVVGTGADTSSAGRIAGDAADAHVIDITGKTDLPTLAGLLVQASGFVGNDSGATHLAAACGIPTVSIFLSTDPVHTAQRGARVRLQIAEIPCRPCMKRSCPRGTNECRDRVSPESVLDALEELRT